MSNKDSNTPNVKIKKTMNPALILFSIVIIAMLMTFFLPSGKYQRDGKLVVPNSFETIPKEITLSSVISSDKKKDVATPVGIADMFTSIPEGLIKQSALIFMVLFIGGMFGILDKSGSIELGLQRALYLTKGNIYFLVPVLMIIFSAGSTFMGLAKEYLIVIPMVIALVSKLKLSKVIGLAIVTIAVKVGYLASITNPYALSIAQPLLGLQLFSGLSLRILTYVVMMTAGILFVIYAIKRELKNNNISNDNSSNLSNTFENNKIPLRNFLQLLTLLIGIAFLVYASYEYKWKSVTISGYYLFLSIVFAIISGMRAGESVDAFISGMKKVLIAAILIGLATSVEIILVKGNVLDTVIHYLVDFIGNSGPYFSAYSIFISQLLLDIAIPSTSGQAAVTMPIMGPVGQLVGITPQTTVLAFLMGNGLTNVITPTSSGLLIFLATAQVGWGTWFKFVWPLLIILAIIAILLLSLAVFIGY